MKFGFLILIYKTSIKNKKQLYALATKKLLHEREMNKILTGCRIPYEFFISKGQGSSDISQHAGSYHLALKSAGIEQCNIITYSSILPKIATEIPYQRIEHGSVMEVIMAKCETDQGELCSCGIIFGWLIDRQTNEVYGGLVAENYGNESVEQIEERLKQSLHELYINGFEEQFELKDIRLLLNNYQPEKKYGCCLVSLNFITYQIPILN